MRNAMESKGQLNIGDRGRADEPIAGGAAVRAEPSPVMRRTDPPARVLALSDHLGHSGGRLHGGTTYYLTVLPALAAAGVELTVCFMAPEHPAADIMRQRGVEPIFLGRHRFDPRPYLEIQRIVADRRIELLHLASFKAHYLGRLVGRKLGLASIIHLHDTNPVAAPMRVLQRSVANATDLALAVSRPVCEVGVRDYGLPQDRVRVLHNGIDLASFMTTSGNARLRLRREWGLSDSASVIGLIGRFHPMKGHAHAIRAMPAILHAHPEAVLVMCGEGDTRPASEALVRELGMETSVRFLGQCTDIPEVLAAVDIVAMPSLFGEGLPYAAIEASAAGRPVVAFPTAGIPEVVIDGRTGLLVTQADSGALAEAVLRLLGDEELRTRLGQGAREHARQFTIERHVTELMKIYRSVLASRWPDRR
jgi:glycosyltransferase involved in cell wall biosynthesis